RLPVLAADLRGARRGRPAGARVPADARAARAVDPHRRLAALRRARSRRDRVRVREGRTRDPRLTVRVGVVAGGLVAQAEHLPYLAWLRDRFWIAALAEPSRIVRVALAARYGIDGAHADYRSLLDAGGLDAVVVCSPHGTHAEVVLAALDAGLHVFVEKPMCITLADADSIVAARDRAGKGVQVGTMRRYPPAGEGMPAAPPRSAPELRYVSVGANAPEFEPYFEDGEIVRGGDVPRDVIERTRREESEQVEQAVGSAGEDVVRAFSESFLGSLLHDLNVVHGMLERLRGPLPPQGVRRASWDRGAAGSTA